MATAKPIASTSPHSPAWRPTRRWLRNLALLCGLLIIVLLAWFWQPLKTRALTNASYGARLGCSCRYIERRSFDACRHDLAADTRFVSLSEDIRAKSVTASVPLLARQTATYQAGPGCLLEKWAD